MIYCRGVISNWTLIYSDIDTLGQISAQCSDGNILKPVTYGFNESLLGDCDNLLADTYTMYTPTDGAFLYKYATRPLPFPPACFGLQKLSRACGPKVFSQKRSRPAYSASLKCCSCTASIPAASLGLCYSNPEASMYAHRQHVLQCKLHSRQFHERARNQGTASLPMSYWHICCGLCCPQCMLIYCWPPSKTNARHPIRSVAAACPGSQYMNEQAIVHTVVFSNNSGQLLLFWEGTGALSALYSLNWL